MSVGRNGPLVETSKGEERPFWLDTYLGRWYGGDWVDGTTEFHRLCASVIADKSPSAKLLEIGSGPSNASSNFFASLGHLVGVDTDPVVHTNTALKQSYVVMDEELPFQDDVFDACFSSWALEHFEDPSAHLREVHRVLKTEGCYVARTPNSLHYVSVVARLTPHSFHKLVANRLRRLPHGAHDPWETYYRLNTPRSVRRVAIQMGFEVVETSLHEYEPSYGKAARPLFLLLMVYERLVNRVPVLAGLRHTMFVVLRKRQP